MQEDTERSFYELWLSTEEDFRDLNMAIENVQKQLFFIIEDDTALHSHKDKVARFITASIRAMATDIKKLDPRDHLSSLCDQDKKREGYINEEMNYKYSPAFQNPN
jgi:hypothetical protein